MSDITCTIKLRSRVAECCGEHSRFALGAARVIPVDETNVLVVATDGKCASIVEVEGNAAGVHAMPAAAAKPGAVQANGVWQTTTGSKRAPKIALTPAITEPGRFPNVAAVMPEDISDYRAFNIDVKLLARIAAAVTDGDDAGSLTIFLPPAKDGESMITGALPCVGNLGVGAAMPLSADDANASIARDRRAAYDRIRTALATAWTAHNASAATISGKTE